MNFHSLLAGLLPSCAHETNTICGWCDLMQLCQNVIKFVTEISLLLAVIFIVYGGLMMMIFSYRPEKISESKEIIKAAVIGVIIITVSWVLLNTLFHLLTGKADWPWNQIQCI